MRRSPDIRTRQAEAVRAIAYGVDEAIRSYPAGGSRAHLENAQQLKREALAYVPEGDHRVVHPAHALQLLAWARAWLDAGDPKHPQTLGVAAKFRARQMFGDPRALAVGLKDPRVRAVGKARLPLPAGPPEEWEDNCERELVA